MTQERGTIFGTSKFRMNDGYYEAKGLDPVAERAKLAPNPKDALSRNGTCDRLREAAQAFIDHLDTAPRFGWIDNDPAMLTWAATEYRLQEGIRAALVEPVR